MSERKVKEMSTNEKYDAIMEAAVRNTPVEKVEAGTSRRLSMHQAINPKLVDQIYEKMLKLQEKHGIVPGTPVPTKEEREKMSPADKQKWTHFQAEFGGELNKYIKYQTTDEQNIALREDKKDPNFQQVGNMTYTK